MTDNKGRIYVLQELSGATRFGLIAGPFDSSSAAETHLLDVWRRDGTYYIIRVQRQVDLNTIQTKELKRLTFKEFFEKEDS